MQERERDKYKNGYPPGGQQTTAHGPNPTYHLFSCFTGIQPHPFNFTHCLTLLLPYTLSELSDSKKDYLPGPQSLKYSLPGPLQEKFANPRYSDNMESSQGQYGDFLCNFSENLSLKLKGGFLLACTYHIIQPLYFQVIYARGMKVYVQRKVHKYSSTDKLDNYIVVHP